MKYTFFYSAVVLAGIALLPGCFGRPTKAERAIAEKEKDLSVRTVGDVTIVDGVAPAAVHGVGLVVGLAGGGHCPPGKLRVLLEQQLRKQDPVRLAGRLKRLGVNNIKEYLDSGDCALVTVSGSIPVGARRGDLFDVEISLPQGSRTASLAGGVLEDCPLRTYDTTKNLSPDYDGANVLLQGHILARAQGPLMVGFGASGQTAEVKRASVWQGGISLIDKPYSFVLTNDDKSVAMANAIAQRVNSSFREGQRKNMSQQQRNLILVGEVSNRIGKKFESYGQTAGDMAKVVGKDVVQIRVPYTYRLNAERYIRVARLTPLTNNEEDLGRYRARLAKMILQPGDCIRAAIRLEALGKQSEETLVGALKSQHPMVRFAAAEALTYLGNPAGTEQLGLLARSQPMLASYCLVALANLDEGVCRRTLIDLLKDESPEVRGGAFNALRNIDDREPSLAAEHLSDAYWLHAVAPGSTPLVHFAIGKRPEVVCFGNTPKIVAPVRLLAGDFTVTCDDAASRVIVSRISAQTGVERRESTTALADVIRALASVGAGYPEVVHVLRELDENKCVNCPIRAQVLPQVVDLETLVEGSRNPEFLRSEGRVEERVRELLDEATRAPAAGGAPATGRTPAAPVASPDGPVTPVSGTSGREE